MLAPSLRGELSAAWASGPGHSRFKPLFRRSAHRFFIATDKRLLPSGVSRRRRLFAAGAEPAITFAPAVLFEPRPSSAAMALLSRVISCFNSATILSVLKIRSFRSIAIRPAQPSVKAARERVHLPPTGRNMIGNNVRIGFGNRADRSR